MRLRLPPAPPGQAAHPGAARGAGRHPGRAGRVRRGRGHRAARLPAQPDRPAAPASAEPVPGPAGYTVRSPAAAAQRLAAPGSQGQAQEGDHRAAGHPAGRAWAVRRGDREPLQAAALHHGWSAAAAPDAPPEPCETGQKPDRGDPDRPGRDHPDPADGGVLPRVRPGVRHHQPVRLAADGGPARADPDHRVGRRRGDRGRRRRLGDAPRPAAGRGDGRPGRQDQRRRPDRAGQPARSAAPRWAGSAPR